MCFLLLAKTAGVFKDMTIAHAYGTGPAVDAYALGLALSQTPVTCVAMVAYMVLIPLLVAQRHGDVAAKHQAQRLVWITLAASLPLALLVYGIMAIGLGGQTGDPAFAAALRAQAAGMALSVPPGCLAGLLAARMMAARDHGNSLLEALPALTTIAAIMAFDGQIASSPLLGWSLCAGICVYAAALMMRQDAHALSPRGIKALKTRAELRPLGFILAAQLIFVMGGDILDQSAAFLLGEGQAILAYANRMTLLLCALAGTAIGRAMLPVLAETAQKDAAAASTLVRRWSWGFALGGALVAGLGVLYADEIVALMYQRGAFLAADAAAVAQLFALGLLILPFYVPAMLMSQMLVIRQRYGVFFGANFAATLAKLALIALLLDDYGLMAIVAASVLRQILVLALMIVARPAS